MKIPMPPPRREDITEKLRAGGGDRLLDLFTKASLTEVASDPYLPWDRLRYKTPPGDLDHHEWWLITKLRRQSLQRRIPLRDKNDFPFTYALTDSILRGIERVNRDLSGHIGIAEQVANPATRDRYLVNSLIEEAITSSQLEGAITTHAVAKEMIKSGRPPTTRDERMILNNYHAMQRVRELRGQPLTIDLLCEVHRVVTEGTLSNPMAAGRFQLPGDERVIVGDSYNAVYHVPPPAESLPGRVQRLCDFANSESGDAYVPGVIRAVIVHFMIGYEHPFENGNGRTARALFYWMMLNQGYWLTEFLSISRILKGAPSKYARSFIYTEQDDADLTYFILYQLEVIQRAIDELHSYLERKVQEVRDFQRSVAAMPGEYNYRQIALLRHALRHPNAHYTVHSHGMSHGVVRQTARQDLVDLERRGLLERSTVGRRFIWRPADDIVSRVST